jgi:hypothetical protein
VASVFVSHSSRDRQATRQVSDGLRAAGFGALFVDFDPDLGIPGGRNWEQELYTRLRRADAMVFLASAASVASQWCFAEISLARSLGRPLIPVRLEPDVRMPLLDMVQWIDIADARSGFSRLVDGLRSAGLNPEQTFAWNTDRPPYPGLASFDGADAAVFFGRERETARLVELLQPTLRHGSGRFVAIVGPSGSGKSSLLRAGLLPRLTGRAGRWIPLPPLRPAERPVAQLARCLADAFADHGRPCAASELVAVLGRGPSGLVQLARELAELGRSVDGQPRRPDRHRPGRGAADPLCARGAAGVPGPARRSAGREQPDLGGRHPALGVPQRRSRAGRARGDRRRHAGHRAVEPVPVGRSDRQAGLAGRSRVRAEPDRTHGARDRRW